MLLNAINLQCKILKKNIFFQATAKANVHFDDEEEPTSPINLTTEPEIRGHFVNDFDVNKFPFEDKTTLWEGDSLKIYVQKVSFLRQKKLILDDHQFIVRAEYLNNRAPLLSSILNVLEKSLEHMLTNMR